MIIGGALVGFAYEAVASLAIQGATGKIDPVKVIIDGIAGAVTGGVAGAVY